MVSNLRLILNPEPEVSYFPLLLLPDDIIREICAALISNFNDWEGPENLTQWYLARNGLAYLKNFSQTTRRIYSIAIPYLYQTLLYDYISGQRPFYLLRTLSKYPQLAAHVKQITCLGLTKYRSRQIPCIEEMSKSLGVTFPPYWTYPRRYGTPLESDSLAHDFIIDHILSLTKNLRRLSLVVISSLTDYGDQIQPSANLSKVKELNLFSDGFGPGFSLSQARRLCERLPNLERLTLDKCQWTTRGQFMENVKCLTFTNSMTIPGQIRILVTFCKALESFSYHYYETGELRALSPIITPKDIVEELSVCKPTLRHLQIEISDCICEQIPVKQDCVITSLEEFSALKVVVLNRQCIYNYKLDPLNPIIPQLYDLLPASVEVIKVTGMCQITIEMRLRLNRFVKELESYARALPHFREFHIVESMTKEGNLDKYYRQEVRRLAEFELRRLF